MELEHSFTIPVPLEQAWGALLDVEQVAPCMPGATVDSVTDEEITGRIKVKVGPVTLTYTGKARFSERDAAAHSVTLEASGRETRGAGTATATVRSMLRGEGEATEVIVHTSLAVTGRPAQFGRGMLTEVGGRIIDRFAANLAAQLAGGQAGDGQASGAQAGGAGGVQASGDGGAQAGGDAGRGADDGPGAEQSIDELRLSARATASLRLAGLATVGDVAASDESRLLALPGIGPQTISQIRSRLAERGLSLSGRAAAPEPGVSDAGLTPGTPARGAPATSPAPAAATTATPGPVPAGSAAPGPVPATEPAPAATAAVPARPSVTPLRRRPPDEEAIDLLEAAGLPVLKRVLPAAGVLAFLVALVVMLVRRRRSAPPRRWPVTVSSHGRVPRSRRS